MEKKLSSLEKFMNLVETKYPLMKPFISRQEEHHIEIHISSEEGKTWAESSEIISPLFEYPNQFSAKKVSVSFNEKHNFYNVAVDLI